MKKLESGRSMVEMLGVLAIIGVLPVGGIAGYMLSMNRFRANNMIDKAGKFATIAYSTKQTATAMGKTIANSDIKYSTKELGSLDTSAGEAIALAAANPFATDGTVNLEVTFSSQDVCETAMSILGEQATKCTAAKATLGFKQN